MQGRVENMLLNRSLFFLVFFFLLTGCTLKPGGEAFFSQLDKVETALEQQDWKEVAQRTEELQQVYQKEKWKIQLLGDEGEYEQLLESINKMIAITKEKDSSNVRLELAAARTLVENIYSL